MSASKYKPVLDIIREFLIDLDERTKEGLKLQIVGCCVYNTQVGNQGAYCVLKDLQERIKDLERIEEEQAMEGLEKDQVHE